MPTTGKDPMNDAGKPILKALGFGLAALFLILSAAGYGIVEFVEVFANHFF